MAAKRRILTATAVLTLTLGAAGCSSEDSGAGSDTSDNGAERVVTELEKSSPREIADRAVKATKAADSLRVKAEITTDEGRLAMNMGLAKDGRCTGSVTMAGAGADVIGVGEVMYLKGDERFWRNIGGSEPGSEQMVQLLKNRWLKTDRQSFGAGEFCDLEALLDDMDSGDLATADKGEVTDLDGRPVIPLTDEEDGGTTTVHVANDDDKPYILQAKNEGGDEPGVMDFTDYDKPLDIEEPDPDEVVDTSELKRR